jgi:hypothetical protein
MRYPVLTSADASTFLFSSRAGGSVDLDSLVKTRGDGPDLDQSFVEGLREALAIIRASFPDGLNHKDANIFEARAARAVHERIPIHSEVIADPDFWVWLAVVQFSELVEWRYGDPADGTSVKNYGVGARVENLLYRLWLRAELVLDEEAKDRYHLVGFGQIDFYRSHLFRQGYANAHAFARALLRYQYQGADPCAPHLKVAQIRVLVKRLRRLRANLFLEILAESECASVIKAEAASVISL